MLMCTTLVYSAIHELPLSAYSLCTGNTCHPGDYILYSFETKTVKEKQVEINFVYQDYTIYINISHLLIHKPVITLDQGQ